MKLGASVGADEFATLGARVPARLKSQPSTSFKSSSVELTSLQDELQQLQARKDGWMAVTFLVITLVNVLGVLLLMEMR